MKIYHNPRCSKSRQGLAILSDAKMEFETIKYLENPISKEELISLLKMLDLSPLDLVRKNEQIWKERYKGASLTNDEVIEAMVANPKLIERPIVVNNGKAVIGRPPEIIKSIL